MANTTITDDLEFVTDGSDGKVYWVSESGDFSMVGVYIF